MPAYLVAGMAFGDEGKGSTTDALVDRVGSDLVVRYNGGAQAAHNVIMKDGRHHMFQQFGSGTLRPGVRTYLSKYVLINPVTMMMEEEILRKAGVHDAWSRMIVDSQCPVITPYHRAFNRLQEIQRGAHRHGSTGMGIGETRYVHLTHPEIAVVVGDIFNGSLLRDKLHCQREYYLEKTKSMGVLVGSAAARELNCINSMTTITWYAEHYQEWYKKVRIGKGLMFECFHNPVFEGAQGVLLDEEWGFQPHTTWTNCTFENAQALLKEAGYHDGVYKIGVWRCYFTRHGAGPLPSESEFMAQRHHELHNKAEAYTGAFRVGAFDLPLALYANHAVRGLDGFVINHLDEYSHVDIPVRVSRTQTNTCNRAQLIDSLEELLRAPLIGQGDGPTSEDKSIDLGAMDAKANNDVWPVGIGQVHHC